MLYFARNGKCLLVHCLARCEVALPEHERAHRIQQAGMAAAALPCVGCERSCRPNAAFRQVAASKPEMQQTVADSFRVPAAFFQTPIERSTQVVVLGVQPLEPFR